MLSFIKSLFFRPVIEPVPQVVEIVEDKPLSSPFMGRKVDPNPLPKVDDEDPFQTPRMALQMTLAGMTKEKAERARTLLIFILLGRVIELDRCMDTADILNAIPEYHLDRVKNAFDEICR